LENLILSIEKCGGFAAEYNMNSEALSPWTTRPSARQDRCFESSLKAGQRSLNFSEEIPTANLGDDNPSWPLQEKASVHGRFIESARGLVLASRRSRPSLHPAGRGPGGSSRATAGGGLAMLIRKYSSKSVVPSILTRNACSVAAIRPRECHRLFRTSQALRVSAQGAQP
jgi:hypothetical protein